jgi:hypothetical protein
MNCARVVRAFTTVFSIFLQDGRVVSSHGLTKLREVPKEEIKVAIKRKSQVAADFQRYAFKPK